MRIEFDILPKAQSRPRTRVVTRKDGRPYPVIYEPSGCTAYKKALKVLALKQYRNPLLKGPIKVVMIFKMPLPYRFNQSQKEDALQGLIVPVSKPDGDNMEKALLDAMNGLLWSDDSQIVECRWNKIYSEKPGIILQFEEVKKPLLLGEEI